MRHCYGLLRPFIPINFARFNLNREIGISKFTTVFLQLNRAFNYYMCYRINFVNNEISLPSPTEEGPEIVGGEQHHRMFLNFFGWRGELPCFME